MIIENGFRFNTDERDKLEFTKGLKSVIIGLVF